jgi:cation diffusion facilitator CzcD-associated flavoprotein CzcO
VILEKQAGLGGTWWDNRYPGAHVDVPAPLYSLSFEPNPRWTRRFAAAPEIQAYMQHCAEKYGLMPHLRFGTAHHEARSTRPDGRWRIAPTTGEVLGRALRLQRRAAEPARWPDIPGSTALPASVLHSARWDPASTWRASASA